MLFTRTEAGLVQYLKLHPDPPPTSNIEICNCMKNVSRAHTTNFRREKLPPSTLSKKKLSLKRFLHLFSRLSVIEFFEELHFHGVADLIVLVREEVKEGGEDAFAKENDQQVEGKNKGGKSSEVKEEQGKKSDF